MYLTFTYNGVDLNMSTEYATQPATTLLKSNNLSHSLNSTLYFVENVALNSFYIHHAYLILHHITIHAVSMYNICLLVILVCVSVHFVKPCQRENSSEWLWEKKQKHQLRVPWKPTFSLLWQSAVVHVLLYVLLFSQLQRAPHFTLEARHSIYLKAATSALQCRHNTFNVKTVLGFEKKKKKSLALLVLVTVVGPKCSQVHHLCPLRSHAQC